MSRLAHTRSPGLGWASRRLRSPSSTPAARLQNSLSAAPSFAQAALVDRPDLMSAAATSRTGFASRGQVSAPLTSRKKQLVAPHRTAPVPARMLRSCWQRRGGRKSRQLSPADAHAPVTFGAKKRT